MSQIFSPGANTLAKLALLSVVLIPSLLVMIGLMLVRSSYFTRVSVVRDQPIPFSHKHHVGGLGIDCRFCHSGVETSPVAGLPPTETCMRCHSQIWTNAAMLEPVRSSFANNAPLRWRRVNDVPEYAYFDHSVHIAKGVGCSTCHGQVNAMPLMVKTHTLYMNWCLACHRSPERHLRPKAEVFSMNWTPPPDQLVQGRKLMEAYHIRTAHLTDCSICHR